MNKAIEELLAIEKIKSLKAKYFRCIDTKDWQGLSECLSEDFEADFREAPGPYTTSRDEFVSMIGDALKDAKTVHHGHTAEITLIGPNSATGIWAMADIVQMPTMKLQGWGHYHELYRKEGGVWLIAKTKLSRFVLETSDL